MTSTTSPRINPFSALLAGLIGSFRHWRLMLIAWLAGLLAATFVARPVFGLFNAALGHHPDAGHVVASQDIAPIVDSVMTLGDGAGSHGMMAIGQGLMTAVVIAVLLTPWLTGMVIASLREGRALGFGELWAGGWREYGRQFRLLLVALIPWAVVGVIALAGGFWARHGSDTQILETIAERRISILLWVVAVASFLAYTTIEAGRAAFAADNSLRSAMRAWLRGLKLILRRPFRVLLMVLVTMAIGIGVAWLLQQPALRSTTASGGMVWVLAQLAVIVIWWTRIARLSALTTISPAPVVVDVAPPAPMDIDPPSPPHATEPANA